MRGPRCACGRLSDALIAATPEGAEKKHMKMDGVGASGFGVGAQRPPGGRRMRPWLNFEKIIATGNTGTRYPRVQLRLGFCSPPLPLTPPEKKKKESCGCVCKLLHKGGRAQRLALDKCSFCLSSDGAKVFNSPRRACAHRDLYIKIPQRAQGGFTQNRTRWGLPQFIFKYHRILPTRSFVRTVSYSKRRNWSWVVK